jgi:hypothetical protein
MITLPILILAIILFAWKEALDDARAIAESNKTKKPFTHDDPDRYIMGIVITLILSVASQLECVTWWALLYFPITWAVFAISFRFLLNRKRGKHWAYVSPSNGYDWWFLKRVWFTMDGHVTTQKHAIIYHWQVYPGGPFYLKANHRAGAIAYGFEATILLASITIYITKTL